MVCDKTASMTPSQFSFVNHRKSSIIDLELTNLETLSHMTNYLLASICLLNLMQLDVDLNCDLWSCDGTDRD